MIRNRIELAEEFARRGFDRGAEIGVADGRYAEILCQTIPDLAYVGVDVWEKYGDNWRSNKYQEEAYKKAKMRLAQYKVDLIKDTSLNASRHFTEGSFDFVFIDGAHDFDNVMLDILLWTPKVRKGGIVSGHDYYFFNNSGIIEAVNAYVQKHKIDLNLTLANSVEHKDDQVPCWWFQK